MRIGIISDTHGMLRPEVFQAFRDVEHILHAGDVGPADLLTELGALAPVTAVWGNTDDRDVRDRVREVAELELGGVRVAVIHGQQLGSPNPLSAAARFPGAGLVVYGHSHQPKIQRVGGTLVVNPGSAGRRRFRLPVSVAVATLSDGRAEAELRTLVETP